MLSSISSSTLKQYEITYKKWWSFCTNNFLDPYNANRYQVITFLQNILETSKVSYGSFNSHRSALSLILPNNIGSDELVKRFLRGIANIRPQRSKYNTTWDPNKVLDFFRLSSSNCSVQDLAAKLATLLVLITGHRVQTIALIKLPNIEESEEGMRIFITDRVKTSRWSNVQPCLHIPYYTPDKRLCVVSTLYEYLERTKNIRALDTDNLFLCNVKPYKAATKQTISRWIKSTLKAAGINTDIFKSHSTRHAATSAVFRRGLSMDIICRSAGWTENSRTFLQFYNRPVASEFIFAKTLLNLSSSNISHT